MPPSRESMKVQLNKGGGKDLRAKSMSVKKMYSSTESYWGETTPNFSSCMRDMLGCS